MIICLAEPNYFECCSYMYPAFWHHLVLALVNILYCIVLGGKNQAPVVSLWFVEVCFIFILKMGWFSPMVMYFVQTYILSITILDLLQPDSNLSKA